MNYTAEQTARGETNRKHSGKLAGNLWVSAQEKGQLGSEREKRNLRPNS